ncbi:hypothetical protein [Kineobactrum salinum]|uniref:Uncharacterized protein n=1 Tax=Kineobactrum salinum TaxID=2708301 RepID=A0A6C0U4P2_9GAMM|nr:hypothetical protein [Kineobactrum salinum]QIB67112.1 hypothetical protein G3T16_18640 [Kineobactrum salinum]
MSQTTEVALFGDKTADLPAHLQDDSVGAMGSENTSVKDYAMPQLKLLQALSPECRSVEGAKEGMLLNSVTQETFDAVFAINLYFTKEYAIFKKRLKGGGFFGNFDTEAEALEELATLEGDPAHYDVVETDKHTLLLLDDEGAPTGPAQIFMSSSKLQVSRVWNTSINQKSLNKPRFSRVWRVGSIMEKNKRGDEYANFTITDCGWAPPALYEAALDGYRAVSGTAAPAEAA